MRGRTLVPPFKVPLRGFGVLASVRDTQSHDEEARMGWLARIGLAGVTVATSWGYRDLLSTRISSSNDRALYSATIGCLG